MAAGVIDTANLPYLQKEMKIDLKGKDVLGKQELIILDMLQTTISKSSHLQGRLIPSSARTCL